MTFDALTQEYLIGQKFSNSQLFQYNFHEPIPDRVSFVKALCKDKNILHLGCLDHKPLISDKISRGQWLHKEITEVADTCLGIDIDIDTLSYVNQNYGFTNIIAGDFTDHQFPEVISKHWNYAILGELLEHIDNPVQYLSTIKDLYSSCIDKIVITVPNAWTQTTIKYALRSGEIINTDHRYWFTPYTLAKVITRSGMVPENIHFANRVPLNRIQLLEKKILNFVGVQPKYNYTFASSIIAIASLK